MIYSNIMEKPSDNMLLSESELNRMYAEAKEALYKEEQDKKEACETAKNREFKEYYDNIKKAEDERLEDCTTRSEECTKLKESLISECLYKLFRESVGFPMDDRDKIIAHNLVNKFVTENGANSLLLSFATKNLLLSEFNRISNKCYNKILEGLDCKDCDDNGDYEIIKKDAIDTFYRDLEDVDTSQASDIIKNRVADAVTDFIDSNSINKMEYEDIINQAKDKAMATGDESIAESFIDMAAGEVYNMRANREMNIFDYMVESLTKSIFKDKNLQTRYMHEGTVDMENVVNSTQLLYTMLEMVNTTDMVNVDDKFIRSYLSNL